MRAKLILAAVLSTLAAVAVLNVVPAAAVDPPPPIAAEPLTPRSVFPDMIDMKIKLKTHHGGTTVVQVDDPSRTVDVRYTVQPGARFPWHSHYGPVIVNIMSGSLTYIASGTCDETTYSPGQAFVDAGPRSRPLRLQPWHGADGVHRHVLRGTRDGGAADPCRPWLLAKFGGACGMPVD